MQLSFLGWGILALFTFNILDIFFVIHYMNLTMAGYYDTLKEEYLKNNPTQAAMGNV